MSYNYSKLDGKIAQCFGTQLRFSQAMGLSERTISLKMNSKRPWKQNEILLACSLLGIPVSKISEYFFAREVQPN